MFDEAESGLSPTFTSSFWHSFPNFSFNKKLETFALKIEKESPSVNRSNHDGYHSPYLEIGPLIKRFYDVIRPEVHAYADRLHVMAPYSIYFGKPWININRKGASNVPHTHAASFLAATYYIKTPPLCGDLCFYNPRSPILFSLKWSRYTNENSSIWKVGPKVGKLIIFPSDLLHGVEPNQSDEPRISLSFNININQKGRSETSSYETNQ